MEQILSGSGFLSSRSSFGSDLSLILAISFTCLYFVAGYFAAKGKGLTHHRLIITSTLAMFGYFLYYYKVRNLGYKSFADQIEFSSLGWIQANLFTPVIYTHFLIVVLSTFVALYAMATGFKASTNINGKLMLKNELATISKLGWALGFIWLAILLWWIFVQHGFSIEYAIAFLILGYFLPVSIALYIHQVLPTLERRHRVIGKISIALFLCLLVTSTLSYSILYIL